jgi:thioredoxin reductase (NADPH)
MDYNLVPTTVFTPIEYGCVGLSEEDAIAKYGEAALDVYHTKFNPLEWAFDKTIERTSYVKVIVEKATDKVVGYHVLAPNAGEMTQGIGIAFQCGLTKKQLDACVGIHPTVAEECVTLEKTKADDPDATKTGC